MTVERNPFYPKNFLTVRVNINKIIIVVVIVIAVIIIVVIFTSFWWGTTLARSGPRT